MSPCSLIYEQEQDEAYKARESSKQFPLMSYLGYVYSEGELGYEQGAYTVVVAITGELYYERMIGAVGGVEYPELEDVSSYIVGHSYGGTVVGQLNGRVDLGSKPGESGCDMWRRLDREFQIVENEISVGMYYGISQYVLRCCWTDLQNVALLGRNISKLLSKYGERGMVLHLLMPICCGDLFRHWQVWNEIRMVCDHSNRLKVCLSLGSGAVGLVTEGLLGCWQQDDVSMVFVLPEAFSLLAGIAEQYYVVVLKLFFRIKGLCLVLDFGFDKTCLDVLSAKVVGPSLALLRKRAMDYYLYCYQDHLLEPMQPLADNLASSAYDVFMLDTPKYRQYEKAVEQAVADLYAAQLDISVLLAGPGKGPLMDVILRTVRGRPFKLVAVDKNPNVISPLKHRLHQHWPQHVDSVAVEHGDIRYYQPSGFLTSPAGVFRGFDLVVSELLGSFGCNELAPECLLHAKTNLANKNTAIFIPQDFSSWIAPVSSPKLYRLARNGDQSTAANSSTYHLEDTYKDQLLLLPKALQRPYISALLLQMSLFPAPAAAEVWRFDYSTLAEDCAKKMATVDFAISNMHDINTSYIHGFAGFFQATLYKDISLSTLPSLLNPSSAKPEANATQSWFPIYFPLQTPVSVTHNVSKVQLMMIRDSAGPPTEETSKVWYEWLIKVFTQHDTVFTSKVHNSNGHQYSMRL